MSTDHLCPLVQLGPISKHPNADSLGITEVDGRPCIVRLTDWSEGDLAVYIPIDSVVPTSSPLFAFLKRPRIQAVRLRGIFSMGLLVRPPPPLDALPLGSDLRDALGISVYEPPTPYASSEAERDPGFLPVYDIESARKHRHLLHEGEEFVLTEKIHGVNARFAFHNGRLWCASHTQFKRENPADLWWSVAHHLDLPSRLRDMPGFGFYGEVYGQVQDLRYGVPSGARFVLFDVLDITSRQWLDYDALCDLARNLNLPVAPLLYRGRWDASRWDDYKSFAEGPSVLANGACVREGWVLRPTRERFDPTLGRVQMKLHGEGFLTRKE